VRDLTQRDLRDAATLVTGGTGLIGGEVILALARSGEPVRAVVRAESPANARQRLVERLEKSDAYCRSLLPLIDAVAGDTAQPMFGMQRRDLCGIHRIIHAAANTQFSSRQDEQVWNTNVSGARHLVEIGHMLPPGARILFISTASVTTAPERSCIDEEAPFAGHANTYSRSKREAEAIVRDSDLDIVIVRPSIVLSRGVRDRAMARSILWAVPIMGEIGEIPVDPEACVDLVPVDYVAQAIAQLAVLPSLDHRLYHVSAGRGARTFGELREAVIARHPDLERIQPVGRGRRISDRARARLLRPLDAYLPFINAGVQYVNDRFVSEAGAGGLAPSALSYVPELVGLVTLKEALDEMYQP
jgi:nucleoside-diphosphate-sugar epimerase